MASLTRRRMPSAKPPEAPWSVKSCRTVFKSSGFVWWVVMDLFWMCLLTPQQETIMARPRPVYDGGSPPLGGGGGGCAPARYARLRSAAPEGGLGGVKKSNLQNDVYTSLWCGFGVALRWLCTPESMPSICLVYGFVVALIWLWVALPGFSRFEVRGSRFKVR